MHPGGPDQIAAKLDILRRHCSDVGRDPNEIEVTASYRGLPPGTGVGEPARLWKTAG